MFSARLYLQTPKYCPLMLQRIDLTYLRAMTDFIWYFWINKIDSIPSFQDPNSRYFSYIWLCLEHILHTHTFWIQLCKLSANQPLGRFMYWLLSVFSSYFQRNQMNSRHYYFKWYVFTHQKQSS